MYFNHLEKLSQIQTITLRLRLSEALCFKLEMISSEYPYFLYADMVQWSNRPMDQWTNGPIVQWTNGPIDQWTIEILEHWNIGTFEH